jgi:hypothetical protein
MFAVSDVETGFVDTVKVVEACPAGIVTPLGTVASEVDEVRLSTAPPVGAMPFRVAVPVDGVPPVTELGDKVTDLMTGGVTVRVAVAVAAPTEAVMFGFVVLGTGVVDIAKLALVPPAATVTEVGVVALGSLDPSATTQPPVGAGPLNVIVPVDGLPPVTDVGLRDTVTGTGGAILRFAVTVAFCALAVIVAVAVADTADVVIEKVAVVDPAETETVAGTTARGLLDERLTTAPPAGAGRARVTVPVDVVPPGTGLGDAERLKRNGVPIASNAPPVDPLNTSVGTYTVPSAAIAGAEVYELGVYTFHLRLPSELRQ